MDKCACCGRPGYGLCRLDGGRRIHSDCWDEHHSDPTTEWPPGHVCVEGGAVVRLYVWRSPWGDWVVSTTRKERYLRGFGRSVYYRRTHAEAFADAWARTHGEEAPDGR